MRKMGDGMRSTRKALSDRYLDRLLAREDFWALAAFDGDQIIGGVTAHSLPMTNTEAVEVFIYFYRALGGRASPVTLFAFARP